MRNLRLYSYKYRDVYTFYCYDSEIKVGWACGLGEGCKEYITDFGGETSW
jgi:hypothetical protein